MYREQVRHKLNVAGVKLIQAWESQNDQLKICEDAARAVRNKIFQQGGLEYLEQVEHEARWTL